MCTYAHGVKNVSKFRLKCRQLRQFYNLVKKEKRLTRSYFDNIVCVHLNRYLHTVCVRAFKPKFAHRVCAFKLYWLLSKHTWYNQEGKEEEHKIDQQRRTHHPTTSSNKSDWKGRGLPCPRVPPLHQCDHTKKGKSPPALHPSSERER